MRRLETSPSLSTPWVPEDCYFAFWILTSQLQSGSAVVADDARGQFLSDKIYDDTDVDSLKAIPAEALHRSVDLAILEADTSGYVNALIIVPATIYGTPTHEIAMAGLSNIHSIQIPGLIKAALARGRAGVVGAGKSKWSASHVDDGRSFSWTFLEQLAHGIACPVASLYILLLNAVLEDPLLSHGWDGFYFVGDIEFSWYDLSRKIGEAMVTLGLATEAEPTEFDADERTKFFWTEMFANVGLASNCRVRPTRGLALGWKPTHSIKDLWAFVQPEVESLSRS